jgi:molybdate transport system regulatory protein
MPRVAKIAAPPRPELRWRMRVNVGERVAVGPGKIDLLEAIGREGSISAAAKSMGMSYRRAWLLIDELNRALKAPAVLAAAGGTQGGGTELTETGRALIALYRGIEAQAREACRSDIRRLMTLLAA